MLKIKEIFAFWTRRRAIEASICIIMLLVGIIFPFDPFVRFISTFWLMILTVVFVACMRIHYLRCTRPKSR